MPPGMHGKVVKVPSLVQWVWTLIETIIFHKRSKGVGIVRNVKEEKRKRTCSEEKLTKLTKFASRQYVYLKHKIKIKAWSTVCSPTKDYEIGKLSHKDGRPRCFFLPRVQGEKCLLSKGCVQRQRGFFLIPALLKLFRN